ncbi:MAG TPA: xanthine dehydrogenase family protein subunit M [Thermoanaerobaculia bacterium]|jgi:CO/xanthine dehydrogenase FAD-binding subunit|nr:xanthine dehydrogenase family protein subunit M [Thermoanaerobaculia bacterium]
MTFVQPHSLEEAVRYLEGDPALVPAAGCTDLMVRGVEALHKMERVIDLLGVPELRGIREVEGGLEIGATTPFSEIRRSAAVRSAFPALADAAGQIGGWQIQNRATLGGNLANASPAGDSLPVLLALNATVVLASARGFREIPYDDFHSGYRKTALQPGEIVARIRLPLPVPGTVQAFRKVGTREAQAISKVVVAMAGRIENGLIADLRLAAGSVAPTPIRLRAAEDAVRGQRPGPEAAALAGREAAGAVTPIDDVRSTAEYRSFALERVVRRMVLELT